MDRKLFWTGVLVCVVSTIIYVFFDTSGLWLMLTALGALLALIKAYSKPTAMAVKTPAKSRTKKTAKKTVAKKSSTKKNR